MTTYFHARRAKLAADPTLPSRAVLDRRSSERSLAEFARRHPAIGTLVRKGAPVYYVFAPGGEYRESRDPRDLVAALGVPA